MTKLDVSSLIREISKIAPFALIACALLSFIAVGIFSVDYYEHLFLKRFTNSAFAMAVMVASIQEAVRFGLLISSVRDFSEKNAVRGWLGLIASAWLVFHDIAISKELAMVWNPENPTPYTGILVFLIVIGLVLELRLILTVSAEKKYKKSGQNGQIKNAHTAVALSLDD